MNIVIYVLTLLLVITLFMTYNINSKYNTILKLQENDINNKERLKEKINNLRNNNENEKEQTLLEEINENKNIQKDECRYYKKDDTNKKDTKETGIKDSLGREVFWVGPNKYTYEESKAVCQKLGARLATKEELKNAYLLGANWCNYGWLDKQNAMYPIQEDYWNTMDCKKKINSGHPCGEIGINGGYMHNSKLKYGATCFGIKPNKTEKQKEREQKYIKKLKRRMKTDYKYLNNEEIEKLKKEEYDKYLDSLDENKLKNNVGEFNNMKVQWNNDNELLLDNLDEDILQNRENENDLNDNLNNLSNNSNTIVI